MGGLPVERPILDAFRVPRDELIIAPPNTEGCMTATNSLARPAKPIVSGTTSLPEHVTVRISGVAPLVALTVAVPFAWRWGLSWLDIGIAAFFFVLSGLGVTAGYHRLFTHGSLKGHRPLRIAPPHARRIAAE